MVKNDIKNNELIWQKFAQDKELTDLQLKQFKIFYQILIETNEIHNLTAITDLKTVIDKHFLDSLIVSNAVNLNLLNSIVDVGTGGGFPGIPIKIKFPNLKVILIEVSKKKIDYLNYLIAKLELNKTEDALVEICDLDWLTFLRKTNYQVNLFCARASLRPPELLRMFQPTSPYKNAQLVYWASKDYELGSKEIAYLLDEYWYKIGNRRGRLIFFSKKANNQ